MVQEARESVEHTQSSSENTQQPQSESSRRKPALLPWFIAISGFLTAVAAVLTSIGAPEIFSNLAESIGLRSSPEESQIEVLEQTEHIKVEFIVQGEDKQPIKDVEVQFRFAGAPEPKLTNTHGYVDISIPDRDDIDIVLTKEGFEIIDRTINLKVDPENIKIITLKKEPSVPQPPTKETIPVLQSPEISSPPSSPEIENIKPLTKDNEKTKHQVTAPTETQENKPLIEVQLPSPSPTEFP